MTYVNRSRHLGAFLAALRGLCQADYDNSGSGGRSVATVSPSQQLHALYIDTSSDLATHSRKSSFTLVALRLGGDRSWFG
jgi:hypothetical protein